ncbi:MAG: spore coat protein [Moorellales bacterium]
MQLSDKDILSDALTTQKYLVSSYNLAITEAANPQLRQDFMAIWQEEQNLHRQVFDAMSSRGWYQINSASPQDVAQVQRHFQTSASPPTGYQFR